MLGILVSRPMYPIEKAWSRPAISNKDKKVTKMAKMIISMIEAGLKKTCCRFDGTIYVTPEVCIIASIRTALSAEVAVMVNAEQISMNSITSLKFCLKSTRTFFRNDQKSLKNFFILSFITVSRLFPFDAPDIINAQTSGIIFLDIFLILLLVLIFTLFKVVHISIDIGRFCGLESECNGRNVKAVLRDPYAAV